MSVGSRAISIPAVLFASVIVLAGCADEGGEALPSNGTISPKTTASSQAPGTPASELEAVSACDLLTDDEAATISQGLEAKDLGSAAAHSVCEWRTSVDRGVPIEDGLVFDIATRPTQNLEDLQALDGGKVTDGKVGQRKAKQIAEDGRIKGSCLLGIAVGAGRVDIGVERVEHPGKQSYDVTEKACEDASKVSTIIEPKLPQG